MAAKGYFDALVKLGELASDSQGSKELGECWRGENKVLVITNMTADEECAREKRCVREEMKRGRGNVRPENRGKRGESGAIVGRLTTPHDLIVMLKTAGEAGRSVGRRDASHHILQGPCDRGRGLQLTATLLILKLCQRNNFFHILA